MSITRPGKEPVALRNFADAKTVGTTSALLHMGRGAVCAEFTPVFKRGSATYRSLLTKPTGEWYLVSDFVRKGIERGFPQAFKYVTYESNC